MSGMLDWGPKASAVVCDFLSHHPAYTSIDLSGNPIGEIGCRALAVLLTRPTCSTSAAVSVLFESKSPAIASHPVLDHTIDNFITSPRAGDTLITNEIGTYILPPATIMDDYSDTVVSTTTPHPGQAHGSNITELNLSSCDLGGRGAPVLFAALADAPGVTRLNLNCNRGRGKVTVGRRGGMALQRMLTGTPSLTQCDLQNCNLADAIPFLRDGLSKNQWLTHLDVGLNNFSNADMLVLCDGLQPMRQACYFTIYMMRFLEKFPFVVIPRWVCCLYSWRFWGWPRIAWATSVSLNLP